jgi:purine nucleoside phosphorylase
VNRLEDYTLEFAADDFVRTNVPEAASVAQKHDMKVAFIAGVATLAAMQRRYEREAPERIRSLLEAREAEINELIERYGGAPVQLS